MVDAAAAYLNKKLQSALKKNKKLEERFIQLAKDKATI
jgi:hypothetical protein